MTQEQKMAAVVCILQVMVMLRTMVLVVGNLVMVEVAVFIRGGSGGRI